LNFECLHKGHFRQINLAIRVGIKFRVMKSGRLFLGVLISLVFLLASCTSPEQLIRTRFNTDTFSVPNTTLLYEYTDSYSSATGDCAGMFIDRWYGSGMNYQDIVEIYEGRLADDRGWELWPEDVARIWRKQTKDGLFSMSTVALKNKNGSNPLGIYKLPGSFLQETNKYSTTYAISLRYMSNFGVRKCFKK